MKSILLVTFILILTSCYKRADYSKDICVKDCTIVSGTLVSSDNKPMKGVVFRLAYGNNKYLSVSDNRDFGEATTDENGHFQFKIYMPKDLLGKANAGKFYIDVDDRNLDYNKYILSSFSIMASFGVISKRDTTINFSLCIPEKAFIKVYLENYKFQTPGDIFEATGYSPYGVRVDNSGFQNPLNGYLASENATLSDSTKTSIIVDSFTVAKEMMNMIQVSRIKNGIATTESDTIFVPENNSIELHYSY